MDDMDAIVTGVDAHYNQGASGRGGAARNGEVVNGAGSSVHEGEGAGDAGAEARSPSASSCKSNKFR